MDIKEKVKSTDFWLGTGCTILGIAKLIFDGKKGSRDQAKMKAEITQDILDSLNKNKES